MKTHYYAIAVSALLSVETMSFYVEPRRTKVQRNLAVPPPLFTKESSETTTEATDGDSSTLSSWIELLHPALRADMEKELIAKYIQTGLTTEEAQRQTATFLSDSDQAEKYFEMRMYTEANTQSWPMTVLQILGGFFVGFAAIAGPKLINH